MCKGDLFLAGTSPVGLTIPTLLSRNFFFVIFISHHFHVDALLDVWGSPTILNDGISMTLSPLVLWTIYGFLSRRCGVWFFWECYN